MIVSTSAALLLTSRISGCVRTAPGSVAPRRACVTLEDSRLTRGGSRLTAHGRRAGMTLIEVIVAVALMAMLSVGLFTSLQIGATSWSMTQAALMLDRRIATANDLLRSLLVSIVPIEAVTPPGSRLPRYRFTFFQGERRSMRFVSSHSMTGGTRDGLQLTELRVSEYKGGTRVLVNQSRYEGPLSLGALVTGRVSVQGVRGGRLVFRPIRALPTSLIAVDQLRGCNFGYLKRARRGEPARWIPTWDERDALPAAVRIELTPSSKAEKKARAVPVSITAPIYSEKVRELTQAEMIALHRAGRLR